LEANSAIRSVLHLAVLGLHNLRNVACVWRAIRRDHGGNSNIYQPGRSVKHAGLYVATTYELGCPIREPGCGAATPLNEERKNGEVLKSSLI